MLQLSFLLVLVLFTSAAAEDTHGSAGCTCISSILAATNQANTITSVHLLSAPSAKLHTPWRLIYKSIMFTLRSDATKLQKLDLCCRLQLDPGLLRSHYISMVLRISYLGSVMRPVVVVAELAAAALQRT